MTFTEKRLCWQLRANQLDGLHFRRQHPIGPWVLDFYCHSVRLAVEVDGGVHDIPGRRERDRARDTALLAYGIRTVRLPTRLVENSMNTALGLIRAAISARQLMH
jgi:very-short-patch-repair endonuclease